MKTHMLRNAALSVALLSMPLAAQAQTAESVTVIHAGQLLDKPGTPQRGASTIIVRGGRIAEVDRATSRRLRVRR
jgi:hypothetical protein